MMRETKENIIGCFVSGPSMYHDTDHRTREELEFKGEVFRAYIWGSFGISDPLKALGWRRYGNDLKIALFQFYLLPLIEELGVIPEIERYRPKEGAIGMPIIVHDYNFFSRPDLERRQFLKQSILDKIDLLSRVVKRNKLDTKIDLLRTDIERILSQIT